MSLRRQIEALAGQMIGRRKNRAPPRGMDFALDIAYALPLFRASIVFDVGANVGQSAKLFLTKFPSSHIYCFEPVTDTYHLLQHNLQDTERVDCYQLAFGSSTRSGEMILQGSSDMFFLLGQSSELPSKEVRSESVTIDTLDAFCRANKIDRISFLKIDTEGGDLDVLRGAETMLGEQRIDIVQVEAGMSPTNSRHVPFQSLKDFLEGHGYYLFGIYEQVKEWPTGEPHLRRTNPVFISQQVIDKNRKQKRPRT